MYRGEVAEVTGGGVGESCEEELRGEVQEGRSAVVMVTEKRRGWGVRLCGC